MGLLAKKRSGRPFQYQNAYSGHTWSRLHRGVPSTTKQMPMPTTWEADTKEKEAKAKQSQMNETRVELAKVILASNCIVCALERDTG